MSTIINTPNKSGDESAGWVVAIVILVAAIAGGAFLWYQYGMPTAATPAPVTNNNSTTTNSSTNIEITVPAATTTP